MGTEQVTMDPDVNFYGYSRIAQRGIYESLLEFSRPSSTCEVDLVPLLATSWTVSADGKTYTFTLRNGVKFSDGTPFDATAAKWNFDRLLKLNQTPASSLAPVIQAVNVVDAQTLQIVLKTAWAPFIRDITYVLMISPTAATANQVNGDLGQKWLYDHAVGTGPYLLQSWTKGQQTNFVANPNYWGGWDGNHIQAVTLRIVPDPTTRKLMLEKGDADLVTDISSVADLNELKTYPGLVVEPECSGRSIVTFQMKSRGPLADVRVRQAIALAFDYEGFNTGVMKGLYATPSSPLTPGAELYASENLPPFKQDLQKAKQLLTEAGYPNGLSQPLTIWTVSSYLWFEKDASEILQSGLAQLGITLNIVDQSDVSTFLAGAFNADVTKGPDLYGWSIETLSGDPDVNLRMYDSKSIPPAGMNGSFYSNPTYDALLDQSAAELDPAKRADDIHQLEQTLIQDQPAIFFTYMTTYLTYSKNLQGYYRLYSGLHDGMWWDYYLTK
jgi:peptide/nickel transport system substrate-binding protein